MELSTDCQIPESQLFGSVFKWSPGSPKESRGSISAKRTEGIVRERERKLKEFL